MQMRDVASGNVKQIELNLQILVFSWSALLEAKEHSPTEIPFHPRVQ